MEKNKELTKEENKNIENIENVTENEECEEEYVDLKVFLKHSFLYLLKMFLCSLILALILIFAWPTIDPTESMAPTIPAPCICINKIVFNPKEDVKRYDVVNVKVNNSQAEELKFKPNYLLCKRVIGLGGETLEIKKGVVYINGEKIEEPYLENYKCKEIDFGPIEIPEDSIFMMGDNRNNSYDSRRLKDPFFKYDNIFQKTWYVINKNEHKFVK